MKVCNCAHHKVMPVLIILFGLIFLLGYWGTLSWGTVNFVWPILVILAGIFKMTKYMCKCRMNH